MSRCTLGILDTLVLLSHLQTELLIHHNRRGLSINLAFDMCQCVFVSDIAIRVGTILFKTTPGAETFDVFQAF